MMYATFLQEAGVREIPYSEKILTSTWNMFELCYCHAINMLVDETEL